MPRADHSSATSPESIDRPEVNALNMRWWSRPFWAMLPCRA